MKTRKIQGFLNGELLRSQWVRNQYKLIALIVGLVFLYILAGYRSMQQQHRLTDLRKEVRDKKFEYLTLSTELATVTRQSRVVKELEQRGSKLKENKKPMVRVK
jgi:cell division protein FtsL